MAQSLSLPQARKLVLHSQRLPQAAPKGPALAQTLEAIEHLGYIQIDTISVIERAHHHTLWNRNYRYKPEHLDRLLEERKVFEYWAHAAAWLPMRDFRFSLPQKRAIASGERDHWYPRNQKLMNEVLRRIRDEGPLMAKDFEHHGTKKTAEWQSKPAKEALEYLFMQGDLMIPERRNFHKVYDLTERVLPPDCDLVRPGPEEHARFLIRRFLQANGIGEQACFSYLRKKDELPLAKVVQQMLEDQELQQLDVAGKSYLALPDSLALLSKPLRRQSLQILSPFDNLLIQRKRMQHLFDYDYRIECYLPASKRLYGYFSLPVLWNGRLQARMDCKADRKTRVLRIFSMHFEKHVRQKEALLEALLAQLPRFMAFNGCDSVSWHGEAGKLQDFFHSASADLNQESCKE